MPLTQNPQPLSTTDSAEDEETSDEAVAPERPALTPEDAFEATRAGDLETLKQAFEAGVVTTASKNAMGHSLFFVATTYRQDAVFRLHVQSQITGPRGYVKSSDDAYELIRKLSLPNITYLSVMRLSERAGSAPIYYFRLFVDFDALKNRGITPLVYRYGKKKEAAASKAAATPLEPAVEPKNKRGRDGQALYRQKLLDEQVCCPITGCTEERLLIASHIKPWAACNEREKYDPMNGFLLSPLNDRLFDQGFITFTEERIMLVSDWLSSVNRKRLGLKDGTFFQRLPVLPERLKYMTYHLEKVFKGKLAAE